MDQLNILLQLASSLASLFIAGYTVYRVIRRRRRTLNPMNRVNPSPRIRILARHIYALTATAGGALGTLCGACAAYCQPALSYWTPAATAVIGIWLGISFGSWVIEKN